MSCAPSGTNVFDAVFPFRERRVKPRETMNECRDGFIALVSVFRMDHVACSMVVPKE